MADLPIPMVKYSFVPSDGHNVFREKFGSLSDEDWCKILVRSVDNQVIDNTHFPSFPEAELQNRIHGNSGETAMLEACSFFRFVKSHTYGKSSSAKDMRFLDFGSGWGRTVRPFMRDFEFHNLYGFEPDFLFCALARTLNPYVTFLSGKFTPTNVLPPNFFDLISGWSIFSHLSPTSATLWLKEVARILTPGGSCVFTTWGERFLKRLQREAADRDAGKEIHWYSSVCIKAAGSIDQRLAEYERGDFVWFTAGQSTLYGEAFVSKLALAKIIKENELPLRLVSFDTSTLGQDVFVLNRL